MPPASRKTVLVVSADPAAHRRAREALVEGYELRYATDPEVALRLVREEEVCAVLLDLDLPRNEWAAVFLYLRRLGIPVVLLGDEAERPSMVVICETGAAPTAAPAAN